MNKELFDQFETLTTESLDFFGQNIEDKFNNLKLALEEKNILKINSEFSDTIWRCKSLPNSFKRNISFFDISKNTIDLKLSRAQYSLKSWAITQLENNYSLNVISQKISMVKMGLTESNFFDLDKLEVFKQNFSTLSKKMKYTKAAALNEYLSYTEYPVDEQYLLLIIETHRANMNLKNSIRTIPSSKDTLKFSLIIEDYFKQDLDMQQYLKYYPIYLWWHLTNIIPIRIGEFCVIQRDCINKIDEEYFITLPRSKRQLG